MTNSIRKLQNINNYERNDIHRQYVFGYCRILVDVFRHYTRMCIIHEASRANYDTDDNYVIFWSDSYQHVTHIFGLQFRYSIGYTYAQYERFVIRYRRQYKARKQKEKLSILNNLVCSDLANIIIPYTKSKVFIHFIL